MTELRAVASRGLGKKWLAYAAAFSMILSLFAVAGPLAQPAEAQTPTATGLNCDPETDTNPATDDPNTGGQENQHTITCQATDQFGDDIALPAGVSIDGEFLSGPNNADSSTGGGVDINNCGAQTGTCIYTYTNFDQNAGTDVICFFIDDTGTDVDSEECATPEALNDANEGDDQQDVVNKTWQARRATFLDVEPETATNPNGSRHTLIATFTDQFGDPIELSEGQLVDFEIISGPNVNLTQNFRDFECPSNNQTQGGTCTATYTDNQAVDPNTDTDIICAWLSNDGDDDQYDPNGTVEDGGDCDDEAAGETEQGIDPNGQNIPGNEGNDITDVVHKTWQERTATGLNCNPETAVNPATDDPNTAGQQNQHTITCQATDQFGANIALPAGSIDGEFLAGVNDPDAGNNPPVDINNCGAQTGTCTHTYTNNAGNVGTDVICFFIDDTGTDTDTEECATPEVLNDANEGDDQQDIVNKTWAARNADRLDCTPDDATNPVGDTQHTISCTARDQFGALAGHQEIDGEVLAGSANDSDGTTAPGDLTQNTNAQGVATFNVTDNRPANTYNDRVDTFCFWIDDDGNSNNLEECAAPEPLNDPNESDDESDVVRKTWQGGPAPMGLNCNPETATNPATDDPNTDGQQNQHTITCQVTDQLGQNIALPAGSIDGEFLSGPRDPDAGNNFPVDINNCGAQTGTCTYTYTNHQGKAGTDVICFFIDDSGTDVDLEECATPEGLNDANETDDQQDVVNKTWETRTATHVNAEPETATNPAGASHTIGVSARDQYNTATTATPILADITSGPSADQGTSQAEIACQPDPNPGPQNRIYPAGQTETHECTYTHNQFPNNIGGTGTDQITVFADANNNGRFDTGEVDDQVTKTWEAPPSTGGGGGGAPPPNPPRVIDCDPETAQNVSGTLHSIACVVTDRGGQPVSDAIVTFTETGPGDFQGGSTRTTDAQGRVTITTSTATDQGGTQQITGTLASQTECGRAANDPDGAPQGVCAHTVSKTWIVAPPQPACSNNVDDDADGFVDMNDPGCASAADNSETDEPSPTRGACAGVPFGSRTAKTDGSGFIIVGTQGGEIIVGTDGDDTICALGGDDQIDALEGNDQVFGGAGHDEIDGGGGRDQLAGQAGSDTISGRDGNDTLVGGTGDDVLKGNSGIDGLRGGDDADLLQGGSGEDSLYGGDGDDVLRGWIQDDVLYGGAGDDTLNGHRGRDVCRGGPGRDITRNCEGAAQRRA